MRFAYTNETVGWPPEEPYGDADPTQMLAHVDQLAPVLSDNSDVIAVVQAGLIGIWGEWHYSDYFTPNSDYAERKIILVALLDAVTVERAVQVRKPSYKQGMFNTSSGAGGALPVTEAWSGSEIARTGHHNDCFLASTSDFGTYDDLEADKAYLAVETRYVPMGGETCAVSERSSCDTALEELARFHWSYLNIDYHPDVLEGFENEGCMDEIRQRLGYRLVLKSRSVSNNARPGFAFQANVVLVNEGWAAPMNSRPVRLLLRHRETAAMVGVTLPEDPRTWLPQTDSGTVSLDYEVCTPTDLPEGQYDLLLHLLVQTLGLGGQQPGIERLVGVEDVADADVAVHRLAGDRKHVRDHVLRTFAVEHTLTEYLGLGAELHSTAFSPSSSVLSRERDCRAGQQNGANNG